MKSIKINFKSQLQNWNDFFLQTIMFIPLFLYIYYKFEDTKGFIIIYGFLAIQFSFTFYLHIAYYFRNRGKHNQQEIKL